MLSIVVPAYNEEKNIIPLYEQLKDILHGFGPYEIIFVDDGSYDNTFKILKNIASKDRKVKVIRFKRNFGQSAALNAGFRNSKGEIIITMDADLQNHPSDIPKLLDKIHRFDIVCGWRKNRQDPLFSKKMPSLISNWLARKLTGVDIHDFGCTLRAYKKDVVDDLDVYGELHRYIPAIAKINKYSVTEVSVKHSARRYGKTKYGMKRLFKGMSDLLTVAFLERFGKRPGHFFNSLGLTSFGIGSLILFILVLHTLINWGISIDRPLLYISIILIIGGIQFTTLGLMSEMITRLRYEMEGRKFYKIKETINL